MARLLDVGFHSIGFPCERGTVWDFTVKDEYMVFPFNWFPLREGNLGLFVVTRSPHCERFHSIGFPCERGTYGNCEKQYDKRSVSIQLVSPARGEHLVLLLYPTLNKRFHSIGFPCERGTN